ncbi:MAG: division/cell wall cluster transcriptional repressor MraZ [Flavobacteriales bacterium]|jgi:MraZ protein|nr:division/cell wall cluster transcriptional repressor MraZ [Flavobacteriales bacterium]MBK8228865.1 division/cell wall cluster transcriptional repressor MraZ [Flavobacteriales bacterium]
MLNLLGEYDCRLDAKGRLVLPAMLRKQLGDLADRGFVMNRDVHAPCLVIYPMPIWEATTNKLDRLNRFVKANADFIRRFTAGATPLAPDPTGRMLLPYALLKDARLGNDLKLLGQRDRIEVWDAKAYADMRNEAVDMSSLSEAVMGPLGNDDGK